MSTLPSHPPTASTPAKYQEFALTDDSLIFFFGQGEIMPGAGGALQVTVPRSAVAPMLRSAGRESVDLALAGGDDDAPVMADRHPDRPTAGVGQPVGVHRVAVAEGEDHQRQTVSPSRTTV